MNTALPAAVLRRRNDAYAMITLGDHREPISPALRDAPGGFAWWYVDLLDEHGDGLVIIFAFGLPFLPGYASAARAGTAPPCGQRPSLNVVVYRGGKTSFYLLQEYPEQQATWQTGPTRVQLGQSTLCTQLQGDQRSVEIHLDCEVPGHQGRLQGTLRASGPAVRLPSDLALPPSPHVWTPLLTSAPGEARLHLGDTELLALHGRAYHDRNASPVALTDLGIQHWVWGRTPFPDGDRIHYLLWPDGPGPAFALGLHVAPDGQASAVPTLNLTQSGPRRARFGMRWHEQLTMHADAEPWLSVRATKPADDGPFYLRTLIQAEYNGTQALGVQESITPARIDQAWMRPLVHMAVHRVGGPNSLFLKVFTGLQRGGWLRWLGISQ